MTPEDNQRMMRVGPATPMGRYLRSQWIPALRSARVEAGGAPVKSRLLGENFVAFRRSDGQLGFVDEACPHRGVSLALARNDGEYLQSLFHGWKLDVSGRVADCPNVPDCDKFAAGVKTRHYPVAETGNLAWVYLGGGEAPPFPQMGYTQDPQASPRGAIVQCNWVQLVEGTLDPNHVAFLHANWLPEMARSMFMRAQTRFEMVDQPYGFTGASVRTIAEGLSYARVKEIMLPYSVDIPVEPEYAHFTILAVPIDDDTSYLWYVKYADDGISSSTRDVKTSAAAQGLSEDENMWLGVDARPGATRNPDDFRENMPCDPEGLWGQDREAMGRGHPTGLPGLVVEDIAVTESMGRQVDRSRETLNVTDAFVVRFRRRLLAAVDAHERGAEAPVADYSRARARDGLIPEGKTWHDLPRFVGEPRLLPAIPRTAAEPMHVADLRTTP